MATSIRMPNFYSNCSQPWWEAISSQRFWGFFQPKFCSIKMIALHIGCCMYHWRLAQLSKGQSMGSQPCKPSRSHRTIIFFALSSQVTPDMWTYHIVLKHVKQLIDILILLVLDKMYNNWAFSVMCEWSISKSGQLDRRTWNFSSKQYSTTRSGQLDLLLLSLCMSCFLFSGTLLKLDKWTGGLETYFSKQHHTLKSGQLDLLLLSLYLSCCLSLVHF